MAHCLAGQRRGRPGEWRDGDNFGGKSPQLTTRSHLSMFSSHIDGVNIDEQHRVLTLDIPRLHLLRQLISSRLHPSTGHLLFCSHGLPSTTTTTRPKHDLLFSFHHSTLDRLCLLVRLPQVYNTKRYKTIVRCRARPSPPGPPPSPLPPTPPPRFALC